MNKRMVIGLVLVTVLITPASAFEFPRFDFNHFNKFINNNFVDVDQQQNQQQLQTVSIAIP